MEKLLVVLATVLIVLGFSVVGFAREPSVIGYVYYPDTMLGATGTSHQMSMDRQATCGTGEVYAGMIAWVNQEALMVLAATRIPS